MPNNVYIGSRYVPIFDGAWSSIKSYEALTIVEYGNNSFTSKRPVPLNIPPTTGDENDPYWALTGNYNGQISNLQQQINDNTSDITALTNSDNKKELKIKERVILYIGDSYDVIVSGYKWSEISAAKLGVTNYVVRSAGGYGFAPTSGNTWLNYLQNHPLDNANDITDVVIGGGTNDTAQTTINVRNAMSTFNDYIHNTFPNVERIYLAYMGYSHLSASQKTQHRIMLATYLEGAKALGWRFLNGVQNVLRDPRLILTGLNDRVHPNSNGVTQLGMCVAMAISDGMSDIRSEFTSVFTPNSAKVSGNTFNVNQRIYNSNIEFTFDDVTLTAADDLSSYFLLASCPDLGSAINQYKYWPTYVSFGGDIYPAKLFSFEPNQLMLWLRGGVTIPNGTQFQVGGYTYNDLS